MTVIDKKPVPIYEVVCYECKSKIQYKKSEVFTCHISCPVCGVSLWADAIQPVRMEEGESCANYIEDDPCCGCDGTEESHGNYEETVAGVYDIVEEYQNCTVQILTDSRTGAVSVGWWKNE